MIFFLLYDITIFFDVLFTINLNRPYVIGKSRCPTSIVVQEQPYLRKYATSQKVHNTKSFIETSTNKYTLPLELLDSTRSKEALKSYSDVAKNKSNVASNLSTALDRNDTKRMTTMADLYTPNETRKISSDDETLGTTANYKEKALSMDREIGKTNRSSKVNSDSSLQNKVDFKKTNLLPASDCCSNDNYLQRGEKNGCRTNSENSIDRNGSEKGKATSYIAAVSKVDPVDPNLESKLFAQESPSDNKLIKCDRKNEEKTSLITSINCATLATGRIESRTIIEPTFVTFPYMQVRLNNTICTKSIKQLNLTYIFKPSGT